MNIPEELSYTATHEWVRFEGATATVGISDHAQAELGDIVYLELPALGRTLAAKEGAAVVESVKAASDIYTPIPGSVTEINTQAVSDPGSINRDPYQAGWLFKLSIDPAVDRSGLLTAAAYRATL